ncbi:MAG: glucose 1-dehydrogenase [Dehalococcoidia bacterium]|nr:glucose 1-dehydrogenase [Dehalococcoidia bacterium]
MLLDMFRLNDRVAIVTGGGRAIGKAIALGMAEAGAHVAVVDIDAKSAEATAQEVRSRGRKALAVATDVTQAGAVRDMVRRVQAEFGKVDVLVNNAGGQVREPGVAGWQISESAWDKEIALNLKSAFLCSQAVIPIMQQQKQGSIIFISSGGAFIGGMTGVSYGAAKAGLVQLAKSLALQCGPSNIRVNAVAPASLDTPGFPKPPPVAERIVKGIPLGRLGDPVFIAAATVYLASDAAGYVSGHTLVVDGGMTVV